MDKEKRRENEDTNGTDTRASMLEESSNNDASIQPVLLDAVDRPNTPFNPIKRCNRGSASPSHTHQISFSPSISVHSDGISDAQSNKNHISNQDSRVGFSKAATRSPSIDQKRATNIEHGITSTTAQKAQILKNETCQEENGHTKLRPEALQSESKQVRVQQVLDSEASKSWKLLTQFPNSKNEIESLAHVCCQLALARTREDMNEAINRMSIWSKRSSDIALIKLALREFQLLLHTKQKIFSEISSKELNVKWEHAMGRLKYLILQHAGHANIDPKVGKEPLNQSLTYLNEAKRHAFEALKSKLLSDCTNTAAPKSALNLITTDLPIENTQINQQLAKKQNQSLSQQPNAPALLQKPHHVAIRSDVQEEPKKSKSANTALSTWKPSSNLYPNQHHPDRNVATVGISTPNMEKLYDVDLSSRSCKYAVEAEDRFYFPIKSISKIMRRAFDLTGARNDTQEHNPPSRKKLKPCTETSSINFDADAVTLMQECVTEFILYLTGEAAGHAAMNKLRVNINGADVIDGMKNLGFTSYANVLSVLNEKLKQHQDDVSRKKLERKLQLKREKDILQAQQIPQQNGLSAPPHPPIRPGYMATNPISLSSIYKNQQNLINNFHGQYQSIPTIYANTNGHSLHQNTPIDRNDECSKEQPRVMPTGIQKNFVQSSSTNDTSR